MKKILFFYFILQVIKISCNEHHDLENKFAALKNQTEQHLSNLNQQGLENHKNRLRGQIDNEESVEQVANLFYQLYNAQQKQNNQNNNIQ